MGPEARNAKTYSRPYFYPYFELIAGNLSEVGPSNSQPYLAPWISIASMESMDSMDATESMDSMDSACLHVDGWSMMLHCHTLAVIVACVFAPT